MTIVEALIGIAFIVYIISQIFIFLYTLTQSNLVYLSRRKKGGEQKSGLYATRVTEADLPSVTVQLPIFNELYVVERVLNSVAALSYPADRFQIQVLDDSTDETAMLVEHKLAGFRAKGLDISHIKRADRAGFKAGALANGLESARGEFIAVFDADFMPEPDFLLKTIPHFKDAGVGVVQTKWEHINEDYSLLTQLQAFGLDAHFNIEQKGRNKGGHFINFNGTAGVWRKSCILDAGNWQPDTLTEDLDLSYRAQLRGWKFKYLSEVGTPAELPVTMTALKTQQFRWTKGAAECARKNLPAVIKSRNLSGITKIHALFHLANSTVFLCILVSAILSIPLLWAKNSYPQYSASFRLASFSLISLALLSFFYWISARREKQNSIFSFFKKFVQFLSFSMGFSLHNTVAVCEGYAGKKIPFVRTPKFNINTSQDSWKGKRYLVNGVNLITLLEGLLALYFLTGLYLAFHFNDYALLPFHAMLAFGFGYVCAYSLWHSRLTL